MKEIKGSVMINVPAEKAWTVLAEIVSYSEWNPFMTQLSGELKEGGVLDVVLKLPDRPDIEFKTRVIKLEQGREILTTGAIKRGWLTSEHSLLIEPIEESKCVFSQRIVFRGLGAYFAGKAIKEYQKALNRMNEGMKMRCERK